MPSSVSTVSCWVFFSCSFFIEHWVEKDDELPSLPLWRGEKFAVITSCYGASVQSADIKKGATPGVVLKARVDESRSCTFSDSLSLPHSLK